MVATPEQAEEDSSFYQMLLGPEQLAKFKQIQAACAAAQENSNYVHQRSNGDERLVSACKTCGAVLFPVMFTNVLDIHDQWHRGPALGRRIVPTTE